jgi:hypothetical protein
LLKDLEDAGFRLKYKSKALLYTDSNKLSDAKLTDIF